MFLRDLSALQGESPGGKIYHRNAISSLSSEMFLLSNGLGFISGATGQLWAAMRGPATDEVSSLQKIIIAIDEVLLSMTRADGVVTGHDLVSGLCGYIIYAFDRPEYLQNKELQEHLIDRLLSMLEVVGERRLVPTPANWQTNSKWNLDSTSPVFDMGMAHGLSGFLSTLCLMRTRYQIDVPQELVLEISEVISGRIDLDRAGFPPVWGNEVHSGVAWCYGPVSAVIALENAAIATGTHRLQAIGNQLAHNIAQSRPARADFNDDGLCHGLAGYVHFVNRMRQISEDPIFDEEAVRTLDLLLAAFMAADLRINPNTGFLENVIGAAMPLIAFFRPSAATWDSSLLFWGIQQSKS